ncbi:MAG: TolC family protein [Siphonobacter sp.]
MKPKYVIRAFQVLVLSTIAWVTQAQSDSARVWNLEQCLQYARENNVSINTQRLSKATSQQNLIYSKGVLYPNLYGAVSQNINRYTSSSDNSGAVYNTSGSVAVSSSWTLYRGGYLRNDVAQKNLLVQSANLSILEAENSISLQVVQAYLNILVDKESIIYSEDLVKMSQAQLKQMQQQYDAGTVAKKDVVQLEAQLASDQYTLTTAINTERQDKLTLKQLLQLPTLSQFDVVKPDTLIKESYVPALEEVVSTALDTRPEIKNGEINVASAELDLKKAMAGYKPTVSMSGALGVSFGTNSAYSTLNLANNSLYQQLGVSASIPIFTQKLNKTNEAKARISIEQAKLDLFSAKTTLSQSVEQTYINTLNANGQYTSATEQLKYYKEANRITSEELRIGSVNTVEYIQQRNLYIQALQSYIQAKYNAILSLKIYQFYKGEPLTLN